jgi:hypothetical protein
MPSRGTALRSASGDVEAEGVRGCGGRDAGERRSARLDGFQTFLPRRICPWQPVSRDCSRARTVNDGQ